MMKNLKLSMCAMIFAMSQLQAVDIAQNWNSFSQWSGSYVQAYRDNLMIDTTTQLCSVSSAAAVLAGYIYYQKQSALRCFHGHVNDRMMRQANLMYVGYEEFLDIIASVDSYAATLEFIKSHCIDYYFWTSHSKINRYVLLADDLQCKNNKRMNDAVMQENALLEEFKNNLLTAQANIEKEALNDAIDASKNANNTYFITKIVEVMLRVLLQNVK